jgi:hypothetical protein
MFRKTIAILTALCLLSGCASQENRQRLLTQEASCMQGIGSACKAAELQKKINHDQAVENGLMVAAAAILIPLVIVAAAAADRNETPPAPRCWNRHLQAWVYC